MKTLLQCLIDYPDALLRAIAEKRAVNLAAGDRRTVIDHLSSVLADSQQIEDVVAECSPAARGALRELIGNDGWITSAKFIRSYGPIRSFGPARLKRETPWESPIGAAEELWYSGLISRGFAPLAGHPAEVVFIPIDIMPLLGLEGTPHPVFDLQEHPAPAVQVPAGDAFLEDMCTLLSTVDTERLSVDRQAILTERAASTVNERLLLTSSAPEAELLQTGTPLALLVHLASCLGWLTTGRRRVRLNSSAVRDWLEASRAHQKNTLWMAWRDDPEWNDLCRAPSIRCEGTWSHDPLSARRSILDHLQECSPGVWYKIADFVAEVKKIDADFLRPEGNYDSWYVRDQHSGEFLRGFEHWNRVEGRLIAHIVMGPAHWMSVAELGTVGLHETPLGQVPDIPWYDPNRLNNILFCISTYGESQLSAKTRADQVADGPSVIVLPDFCIQVPPTVEILDRFRIGRIADWQSSQPGFQYRITQRSLARAQKHGIGHVQIASFLSRVSNDQVPPNVLAALKKWKVQ